MWGEYMNRRQFLGRFFQGVQTLYNSNYGYGAYHNWPQKNGVPANISVSAVYRYSDSYNTSLSTVMKTDMIFGIFDSNDNLVKCTAYYNNGTLVNDYSGHGCTAFNLEPGIYTVKCMQIGKGLALVSPESMIVNTTGLSREDIPNNNYGYISSQTITVEFIFDVVGLTIEQDPSIDTVGYMYPARTAIRRTMSPPTYEECKSVYLETYPDGQYTEEMYVEDVMHHVQTPLDTTHQYKMGPVYYYHDKLKIMKVTGLNSESEISSIDLIDYLGSGSYELDNICQANNIEYNLEFVKEHSSAEISYTQLVGGINKDGSIESYTWYNDGYLNVDMSIKSNVGGVDGYIGAYPNAFYMNPTLYDLSVGIRYSVPRISIDGTIKYGTRYASVITNVTIKSDIWMLGSYPINTSKRVESYERSPKAESVSEYVDESYKIAKKHRDIIYNTYYAPAMQHYGSDPGDNTTPWVSVQNENYAKTVSHTIPMDAIFGHIQDGHSLEAVAVPSTDRIVGVNSTKGVGWSFAPDITEYKDMLRGYTSDLTEYDPDHQCNNSNMWVYANNRSIFLNQTPTPIDLNSIPDHKIG